MQGITKKKRSWDLFSFSTYKKEFLFCLAAVFIWGMAAHAYGFMQDSFAHDSLNALNSGAVETIWKIRIGRYLSPVYRALTRGTLSMPWTIGLLSLIWIGLAACLIVRMFEVKSRAQIFFIAGILTTNACVSSLTATYIHDLDIDMFALLTGAGAAYLWQKKGWISLICGGILSAVTLALYQSYIGATAVIILFYCFGALYKGEDAKDVWKKCLRALAMLAIGAVLYLIGLKLSSALCDRFSQEATHHRFSSMAQFSLGSMAKGVVIALIHYFGRLTFMHTGFSPIVRLLLCVLTLVPIAVIIIRLLIKKISVGAKLLALLAIVLVPVASGVSTLFAEGIGHELMFYPVYMTYVFALILLGARYDDAEKKHRNIFRSAFMCGLCIMMGLNIVVSNGMYLRRDLEQDAALSMMTRVLSRVEQQEGYIAHETPVAFFGNSDLLQYSPEMDYYSQYTGMGSIIPFRAYIAWNYNTYEPYLKYKMGNPLKLCDTDTWYWLYVESEIENMPHFPAEGSVKTIDGVVCVKFGDYYLPDEFRQYQ